MTEQDWLELERRYREVFGENIPRTMLPARPVGGRRVSQEGYCSGGRIDY